MPMTGPAFGRRPAVFVLAFAVVFSRLAGLAYGDTSPADPFTTLVADSSDPDAAAGRTPLILVHGLHGNARGSADDIANLNSGYFQELIGFLNRDLDFKERVKIYRFHYVSDLFSVSEIGRAFLNDVDQALAEGGLPDTPFLVVAHSMGGIVARAFMNEEHGVGRYSGQPAGARVARLVTLGTPHHGTHAANDSPRLTPLEPADFSEILASFDRSFWCGSALCSDEKFVEVDAPNRADLRWDAYDNRTEFDQCPAECNVWLQSLNADTQYDSKIFAYSGSLSPEDTPLFEDLRNLTFFGISFDGLPTGPDGLAQFVSRAALRGDSHALLAAGAVLLDRIHPGFPSDGLIPSDSAAFLGHDIGRRLDCPGYDHLSMRDSREGSLCENGLELFESVLEDLRGVAAYSFSINEQGGWSRISESQPGLAPRIGYAGILPDAGTTTPAGFAIFGLTVEGILINEASVPALAPVQSGRIFAEVGGPVNTGLAMVNPGTEEAQVDFYFTDFEGTPIQSGTLFLPAGRQVARFLNEPPFDGGDPVLGTLTFQASRPVSVIALRGLTNERSEFLMTTLPVTPLTGSTADVIHFPHFVDGSGWATQIVLVNSTEETASGTVEFFDPGSQESPAGPLELQLDDGSIGSSFRYVLPAGSARRFVTANPPDRISVGSVQVTADPGTAVPAGLAIFSLRIDGVTVSAAGVPALNTGSAFRIYAEARGVPRAAGSIRSGVAVRNATDATSTVMLELTDLNGERVGVTESLVLPPAGQLARFVDEFFEVSDPFQGLLRVTSTADIATVGLRLRVNQRGHDLITTTPPVNETEVITGTNSFFPHLVDGGGWSTQIILFDPIPGQTVSGTMNVLNQGGDPLDFELD